MLSDLIKFCKLRNYFLILLLLCLVLWEVGGGTERSTAAPWVHLKGFHQPYMGEYLHRWLSHFSTGNVQPRQGYITHTT